MSAEPMPDANLAAIEARANAAEAGPWTVVFKPDERPTVCTTAHFRVARCESWAHDHANVAFIAAARTDVPALVAEVRRLRAEVERLQGEVVEARERLREERATTDAQTDQRDELLRTLVACRGERDEARGEVERLRAELAAERAVSASLREQLASLSGRVLGRPSLASRLPCPTCHGDDPSDGPQAHQSCGTCGGAGTVPTTREGGQ